MKKLIKILTILSFVNIIGNLQGIIYGYLGSGQHPELSIFWGYSMFTSLLFGIFFVYFAIITIQGTKTYKIKFITGSLGYAVLFLIGLISLSYWV